MNINLIFDSEIAKTPNKPWSKTIICFDDNGFQYFVDEKWKIMRNNKLLSRTTKQITDSEENESSIIYISNYGKYLLYSLCNNDKRYIVRDFKFKIPDIGWLIIDSMIEGYFAVFSFERLKYVLWTNDINADNILISEYNKHKLKFSDLYLCSMKEVLTTYWKYSTNPSIKLCKIMIDENLISTCNNTIMRNEELIKYWLNKDISIFEKIPPAYQTLSLCKYVINLDYRAIKYIDSTNQTEEICLIALEHDDAILDLITNKKVKDKIIYRKNNPQKEKDKCATCCEKIISKIALIPCGHTQICKECFDKMKSNICPICRNATNGILKIF
jgi:hypothetical protein